MKVSSETLREGREVRLAGLRRPEVEENAGNGATALIPIGAIVLREAPARSLDRSDGER